MKVLTTGLEIGLGYIDDNMGEKQQKNDNKIRETESMAG